MEMHLTVTDAALAKLAEAGFDPLYGARPLKRAIQAEIENPLAKEILEGRFGPKDRIVVDARNGRIVFERVAEAEGVAA
jgi:ATP-dependent Clp protease ATP-binding subunit ClpB